MANKERKLDLRIIPGNPAFDRDYYEEYCRRVRAAEKRMHRRTHNWWGYLGYCFRNERVKAFKIIQPQLTDSEYCTLLKYVWTDSETIFANLRFWLKAISSPRPEREQFMSAEERAFLVALPDQITVYRGYRPEFKNQFGLSWSLSREIAEKLANRIKGVRHSGGEVVELKISKADVFAYCHDVMQEQEIILTPAALRVLLP